ncbi:MAG TPA: endolytic transglycosylase MltG [Candidatus Lachnoclostridium avicola]|nr:endolytic transglycosylase MltG [Candidatus Lachnoclostridium avicola]
MSGRSSGDGGSGTALGAVLKILVYAAILGALIWGAGMGYRFGREIFCPAAMSGEPGREVEITIGEEDSVSSIGEILEKNGLIDSRLIFTIQARLFETEFQPGTYDLTTAMDSREILDVLSGKATEEEESQT